MIWSRSPASVSGFWGCVICLLVPPAWTLDSRPLCEVDGGEECVPDPWSIVFPQPGPPTGASSSQSTLRLPLVSGDAFETRGVIEAETPRIQGFQFGVRHDPEALNLVSASNDGTLFDSEVPGAIVVPPYFSITHLAYAEPTDEGPVEGYASSTAFSFISDVTLPVGRQVVCIARYEVVEPTRTQIRFVDGELRPRNTSLIDFSVTVNGRSTAPSAVIDATLDPAPAGFRRGDLDANSQVRVTDAVLLLRILFGLQVAHFDCEKALDCNDDVSLSDAIAVLNWLFRSGPRLPEPTVECGQDAAVDRLTYARPPACE